MDFSLYTVFLIIYILNIFYILKEDLDTKYIPLLGFYPFVILSGIYYYFEFGYIMWIIPIILYLLCILALDIREYYKWPLSSIGEKWKFLDTWIYDYFLYIFILDIVVSSIVTNFWTLAFIKDFIIIFITTIITWIFFLSMHHKKVKLLVSKAKINSFEELDTALYDRKLSGIKYKELCKESDLHFNEDQKELLDYYKNRVPLFLFGNTFILCFILVKYV